MIFSVLHPQVLVIEYRNVGRNRANAIPPKFFSCRFRLAEAPLYAIGVALGNIPDGLKLFDLVEDR